MCASAAYGCDVDRNLAERGVANGAAMVFNRLVGNDVDLTVIGGLDDYKAWTSVAMASSWAVDKACIARYSGSIDMVRLP
jgi:hypothetical protein